MTRSLSLLLVLAGCLDQAPATNQDDQALTGPGQVIQNAEASFRSTVAQNVGASAAEVGFSLAPSAVSLAYTGSRTLAGGASGRSTLLYLSDPMIGGGVTYAPGVYEVTATALYFYPPGGGRTDLHLTAPTPVEHFHSGLGDYLCHGTSGSLEDFCNRMVACWAWDVTCPPVDTFPH